MKQYGEKKKVRIFMTSILLICSILLQTITGLAYENKTGVINYSVVNIRSGAGTSNQILTQLTKGTAVTITGEKKASDGYIWYQIPVTVSGSKKNGWVRSDCVDVQEEIKTDAAFEEYLTKQGFPETYKVELRKLHAKYPDWRFVAQQTGIKWEDAVTAENKLGRSLIQNSSVSSWKSTQTGAYNWESGKWIELDSGNWVAASKELIAHCMDPRNFLDENYIFQFMNQSYDATSQTKSGLTSMVAGTFLAGSYTEGGKNYNYTDVLMSAAQTSGVSPYILASMILTEQGSNGTGNSISGKVVGYEGYYNFFNIGAYKTSDMTAVQRGLWYAKGSGTGATSYNRPWNTRQKSITGGSQYYAEEYVNAGQDTLYLKRFNVQGSNLYNHQYMTNIQGAMTEGYTLSKAFNDATRKTSLSFKIPVYKDMPASACVKPTKDGSPNNMLKSLKATGYNLSPSFNMYTLSYSLIVPNNVANVTLTATAIDNKATVSGTGSVALAVGTNKKTVKVKAENGDVRNYTIAIVREQGAIKNNPTLTSTTYTVNSSSKTISGLTTLPLTAATLKKKLTVKEGTIAVLTSDGKNLTGNVGTGDKVVLYDAGGNTYMTYQVLVYGDTNGDGKINALDLLRVQKQILGLGKLSGVYKTVADTSRNGKVDALDLLQVQKQIIGKGKIKQ